MLKCLLVTHLYFFLALVQNGLSFNPAHSLKIRGTFQTSFLGYKKHQMQRENKEDKILKNLTIDLESIGISASGPGHINYIPITSRDSSRLDILKLVLAISISTLTWKINVEKFWKQYKTSDLSNPLSNGRIVEIGDGILKEDIEIGSKVPIEGQSVMYTIKLYYNGVHIRQFNNAQSNFEVQYGMPSEIFDKLSLRGLNMPDVITNMQFNGRRKILLPANYAFGDNGLPPFIKANAPVLLDVYLLEKGS